MKLHQSSYRMIRKRTLLLLLVVLLAAGLCAVQAGRAVLLLRLALDGRTQTGQAASVSDAYAGFRLREQMNAGQAAARVNGYMTIAEVQQVELRADGAALHASLYDAIGEESGARWAIVLHGGAGSDRMQVQDVACELSLRGYRVLTPDAYAHGKSGGRYTSLGLREAQDLRAWIDWILLQEPDARIVLLGYDEGAAAVLAALGDGLTEAVRAAAADSAYVSVPRRALQLLSAQAGEVSRVDWMLFRAGYRAVHGMDILTGDLTQSASQADRPLLLIHGTGDQAIPAWHSEDLALAAGENARLLYIEGASHAMGRFADPQLYYDTLFAFFEKALE